MTNSKAEAIIWEERKIHRVLVSGRHWLRWDNNIKMDLKEVGGEEREANTSGSG